MKKAKSAYRSLGLGQEMHQRAGSESSWLDGNHPSLINSAERSSLLQVFVSISGLVLVRNPYHCEPAYAKLEGTKEGSVNSYVHISVVSGFHC